MRKTVFCPYLPLFAFQMNFKISMYPLIQINIAFFKFVGKKWKNLPWKKIQRLEIILNMEKLQHQIFTGYRGTVDAIVSPYWVPSLCAEFFFVVTRRIFSNKVAEKWAIFQIFSLGTHKRNVLLATFNVLTRKNGHGETNQYKKFSCTTQFLKKVQNVGFLLGIL